MEYRFGVSLIADCLAPLAEWARLAEEQGFAMLGLTDSPSVYAETYVSGAVCAMNTNTIGFGVRATNPITRHPLVTASAVLALDELSAGRAMVGIGSGDSGVYSAGRRPATVRELETYTRQVIDLLDGKDVLYRDQPIRLERAGHVSEYRRTRVYVAAAGERTLRMAAGVADGIIIGTGLRPEIVSATIQTIRTGAEEAGRRLEDLDLWWLAACSISKNRAEAIEETKGTLAAMCNATFEVTLEGKHLPEELGESVRHVIEHYDFDDHVKPGRAQRNAALIEDPLLKDYLASRFLVGGSPEECVDQLRALGDIGVHQLWWTMALEDKVGFLRTFGRKIMPALG